MSKKFKAPGIYCDRQLIGCKVPYGLVQTEKQFHAELKRLGITPRLWPEFLEEHMVACMHNVGAIDRPILLLAIRPRPKGVPLAEFIGTVVHEATHVWQEIRKYIGEDKPGDEMEAYAIEQIVSNLLGKMKRI